MSDTRAARAAAIETATSGPGRSSIEVRRAAFAAASDGVPEAARGLLAKVAAHAYTVTDADIAAAAAALGGDAVYELVVCAAMGQATRQLDAALAALDAAEEPA